MSLPRGIIVIPTTPATIRPIHIQGIDPADPCCSVVVAAASSDAVSDTSAEPEPPVRCPTRSTTNNSVAGDPASASGSVWSGVQLA